MTPEQIKEVAAALADAEAFVRRATGAELPGHMPFAPGVLEFEYTREDDDAWRSIRRARAILDRVPR